MKSKQFQYLPCSYFPILYRFKKKYPRIYVIFNIIKPFFYIIFKYFLTKNRTMFFSNLYNLRNIFLVFMQDGVVMNIKIKIGLFVFIIIGVVILNITYKNKNEVTKTKRKKQNNLAIMIKEDGASDYTKSSSKDIPKGNYALNRDKSYCKNNGVIGDYDNNLGKISFSFIGTDSCYLYFDKIIDTQNPVITNLNINGTTVTATLTDNLELAGYGISTSNSTEPTSWTSISGTSYNLSTTITTEGTFYLWVKDSSNNKTTKEFTISLGVPITTLINSSTKDVYIENGLRYEGADPNNYICLDNQKSGSCSDSSLLFRIIGLFDEDTSNDGTTSSGTKKLLKIIDTNNYGGTSGKYWNSAGTNNWSTASLKTELNETYLTTLLSTSNVNSKLSSGIANAKWHLGGANSTSSSNYYYQKITTENLHKAERSPYATSGTLQNLYSGNPEYVFAKVGLMYPSDYGYATDGGTTTNKSSCRAKALFNWAVSSFSYCKNNDWLYTSQSSFVNDTEWLLSPYSSRPYSAAFLNSSGYVRFISNYSVSNVNFAVRPAFYLDSSVLKIVGTGDGTKDNAYRVG